MTELGDRVQAALGDAFRVDREMPSGGMSRIFLATELSLDRLVIIKVLPPELTSEVSAARFRQEAGLLASLQHPHILPILQTGTHDGLLYYIMPFVQGESLRHLLQRGEQVPIDDAVRIIAEVADALEYAHASGVLHRDIKPENILLEGRHAILADFGVARALQQARTGGRLTATGVAVGTPGYMSPEQVAGDATDARADLYALAVVGYELLTGQPPFAGASAQVVLAAHLTTPPLPVVELRPDVPDHVGQAIARGLSKQADDRFQSAREFREALEGRRTGQADPAPRRRSRRGALAAVAVVLLAAVWLTQRGASRLDDLTLSAIRAAVDSGRVDEVARLLDSVSVPVDDPGLGSLLEGLTGSLRVSVQPDARVEIRRVDPIRTFAARGSAPYAGPMALLVGEYVIVAGAEGHQDRVALVHVAAGAEAGVELSLLARDSGLAGRVLVPEGPSPLGGTVPGFLISRTEVTNQEFLDFMSAGGYRDASLWPDRLQAGGVERSRAEALAALVDATGLPGPRNWQGGRFPAGRERHPVTGITWYEARAYARWAGGDLPSAAAWWRAANGDSTQPYPWGSAGAAAHLRANLEGVETAPVASYLAGVSPFGVMDMAGNVREWLGDSPDDRGRYLTSGGSWQEPLYTASPEWMERFPPDHTGAGLGFRVLWWLQE